MTAQNQKYRVQVPFSPVPPDMTLLALHASKGFAIVQFAVIQLYREIKLTDADVEVQ